MIHKITKKVVETTPVFDRFLVKADGILGYGRQVMK
jgi:hypothetical protein